MVAAGGVGAASVTAVKRKESLFHHSTFRKTPRRVREKAAARRTRTRMQGASQTEDDRARRRDHGERARAQTDRGRACCVSVRRDALALARIDAEEFNDVYVPCDSAIMIELFPTNCKRTVSSSMIP